MPVSNLPPQMSATEGGKGFWTRIGSAWAHKDGNGFNIQLESTPLSIGYPAPPKKSRGIGEAEIRSKA